MLQTLPLGLGTDLAESECSRGMWLQGLISCFLASDATAWGLDSSPAHPHPPLVAAGREGGLPLGTLMGLQWRSEQGLEAAGLGFFVRLFAFFSLLSQLWDREGP